MLRVEFCRLTKPLPEIHLLVAADGEVLAANPAARGIPALQGDRPGRVRLGELVSDPPEAVGAYLRACAGSGSLVPGALRLRTAEGECRMHCDGAVVEPSAPGLRATVLLRFRRHEDATEPILALNEQVDRLKVEARGRGEPGEVGVPGHDEP